MKALAHIMLSLTPLFAGLAAAIGVRGTAGVKNLVVFGDSYTDEGRLSYFTSHNGTAPPAGTVIPTSNFTATGGYAWPHFASQKLGATTHNYAVSGAVCSNEIVSRFLSSINGPFPSVIDYEVPAFKADVELMGKPPQNSVYALWIGTNDLGQAAFITDSQTPGATISDYIDCIWSVFDGIYSAGGRDFVLFNLAPLDKSPLYNSPENGGVGDGKYWANKTAYNTTELEQKMLEYTTTVNTVFDYGVPFQLLVKKRWPGASFSIFDVHQLLSDIIDEPSKYLNALANVTGYYYQCPWPLPDYSLCKNSEDPLSSFLWYDELHPSEKTDQIIAAEFVNLLHGNSTYGTHYR
ncbi:Uu.00g109560.m01.CDS01 [Anthostomella pinea]|uniref:Uu.00g109560.m01.CDS01 n=1 Tax=Anthostomella pinea TaxID=933095 RepID=A0AAI8VEM5_9PEZI|nr:Uu.00g109560.m01.CDS01 [Anthostomella pinea]